MIPSVPGVLVEEYEDEILTTELLNVQPIKDTIPKPPHLLNVQTPNNSCLNTPNNSKPNTPNIFTSLNASYNNSSYCSTPGGGVSLPTTPNLPIKQESTNNSLNVTPAIKVGSVITLNMAPSPDTAASTPAANTPVTEGSFINSSATDGMVMDDVKEDLTAKLCDDPKRCQGKQCR